MLQMMCGDVRSRQAGFNQQALGGGFGWMRDNIHLLPLPCPACNRFRKRVLSLEAVMPHGG